jgi:leucyl aminopeptidase (aminopeptidase T)
VLRERVWRAIDVDYAAVHRRQEEVAARLRTADGVHITTPAGTDLRLRIGGRPVLLDANGLPHGEVYVAPHEDSAEGVAVVDRAFIHGRPVERLRLTFERGRVVAADATDPSGAAAFRELLAASSGDKDAIAEFAVGLNPGITEPVGDIMLDEKTGGSVHIAVGMNDRFGGQNRSNLHLDLVMLKPSVEIDGAALLAHGELLL